MVNPPLLFHQPLNKFQPPTYFFLNTHYLGLYKAFHRSYKMVNFASHAFLFERVSEIGKWQKQYNKG